MASAPKSTRAVSAATQLILDSGRTAPGASRRWTPEDREEELRFAVLERGQTPDTIRPAHYRLDELAKVIAREHGSTVVISDVHGQPQLLADTLGALGLMREGNRVGGGVTLVQIGDLLDGRGGEGDRACLEMACLFDLVVAGNHEAAIMGGGTFTGLPAPHMIPELGRGLDRLAWQGSLAASFVVGDILISHAGVHRRLFGHTDPRAASKAIESLWHEFLGSRSRTSAALFGVDGCRGGIELGGVLWLDWRNLLDNGPRSYRQIVGHSPRGSCESDYLGRFTLIDTAGARLGVAVITPDGRIRVGSSWVPRGWSRDELEKAAACPEPDDLELLG
ncbi:metallophosphoesterase [Miltoncostaea oceani]|uniref:metallophosphoesterase n=1 Tax=Miltoncostaea oceani TaxID=2843216 RepID=UPI001C3D834F|nr:metallophosphoesterase [Miltoncostaea oceani]